MPVINAEETKGTVVPSGTLHQLRTDEIIPSSNNPRHLFDRDPLEALKKSIRQHGVLVPITVFRPRGQDRFAILDGERRYRCCLELQEDEGLGFSIPANEVDPPTNIAATLYMFSIHNFREQWELMPTALALKSVMNELEEDDNKVISKLTGLSEPQINRCKIILSFPERFQLLSLDPDSKTRIPSNFWIELYPVLNLCESEMPGFVREYSRDGITGKLIAKYRVKKIKSVIHFRRIMEAFEFSRDSEDEKANVLRALQAYILEKELETREVFDKFVADNRRVLGAVTTCENFISQLTRLKVDYSLERGDLRTALEHVRDFAQELLTRLEGNDPPNVSEEE